MHNIGLEPEWFDCWAFYKKGNTYGRVIVDFSEIVDCSHRPIEERRGDAWHTFYEVCDYLEGQERNYFTKKFAQVCEDKKLGNALIQTFTRNPYSLEAAESNAEKKRWHSENRSLAAQEGWKKRAKK